MKNNEMRSEIEDLQSRLAFQDDIIAGLNKQIARQQSDIISLQQQVKILYRKISDLSRGASSNIGVEGEDSVPPHY